MIPETQVDAKPNGGGFTGFGEPPVTTVLTVDDVEYSIFADPTMAVGTPYAVSRRMRVVRGF